MKTIIAGSRDFSDSDYMEEHLSKLPPWIEISEVVSGCAAGADASGESWAARHNIPVKRFPADWKRHGKAAGPIRNQEMGKYGDGLVAFWDGESRGTKHMIEFMKSQEKWVYVIRTDKTENNIEYTQEKFKFQLSCPEKIPETNEGKKTKTLLDFL